jgi:hypothetical protein
MKHKPHQMSDIKTQTVTTPSGVPVEMKEVLTAGDFIDANDSPTELSKVQLSKRLMDVAVVSVNGVTTDIPTALRALPIADYVFLSKEIAKMIEGNFTKAKSQA